jgi:HEAT repeat protein
MTTRWAAVTVMSAVLAAAPLVRAQEPTSPQSVAPAQLRASIDKLGDLDYAMRTGAARTIRRAPAAQAVPALLQAVAEHSDGYVRYRALVLLTGFNDPRTKDAMRESLESPNDRLRTVAYSFFEHNPDRTLIPKFVAAVDHELAEFVRPALMRALAALGDDPRVQQILVRETGRGQDFFRSVVIEALGDYKAAYAFDALTAVAKLDGPLQTDAALALGKIGDKRALPTLAGLQRTAPKAAQPTIAAAICLLGSNCESHEGYLVETLRFADKNPGFQDLLRAAAAGLGALGVAGHGPMVVALFDIGIPAYDDGTRAPVALAIGTVALRNSQALLSVVDHYPARDKALTLLAEGFDMLEEDLEKERFFALVRRTYWSAADQPERRALMQALITRLEF